MNDNKKFWQRYAPIYSKFMKSADKAYIEIGERVKSYMNNEMNVLELACGTEIFSYMLEENVKTWEATDFSENMIANALHIMPNPEKALALHCVQG